MLIQSLEKPDRIAFYEIIIIFYVNNISAVRKKTRNDVKIL